VCVCVQVLSAFYRDSGMPKSPEELESVFTRRIQASERATHHPWHIDQSPSQPS
jgi:hypothetical protein